MRLMHSASVTLAFFSTIEPLITRKCPAHTTPQRSSVSAAATAEQVEEKSL
jgi:hypothetical protein